LAARLALALGSSFCMPKVEAINRKPPAWRVAEIVDEIGRLKVKLDAVKPDADRYDELRKLIQGWHSDADPAKEFLLQGTAYTVEVSACSIERTIKSYPRLLKRLGAKVFYSIIRVALGELDKLIPEAERAAYLDSKQSGPRRVTPAAIPMEKAG